MKNNIKRGQKEKRDKRSKKKDSNREKDSCVKRANKKDCE